MTVSQWADTYRMFPSDSPEPGRYSTARVPYFKAVMDAFTQPEVRRIAVKSSSQCGKSEVLLNVVGRTAYLDPANILIIQPTLSDAEDFSKVRLSKMIADTKVLTPLFYDKLKSRDPNQTILSKFYRGGRVLLVGSNSPSGLASRPIKILLCDEVDRYVPTSEGDAIDLAAKRTSNYFDARIALFSTPTTKGASRIDIEYELGTQEEWRHQCPNCGEWHCLSHVDMVTDHNVVKDDAGNRTVIVRAVKWRCPQCGFEFAERDMRRTAQAYFAQNPDALSNGVRSFFINGFSSPWLKWCDIMREWLEAQGQPTREAVVMNTRFGQSYEVRGVFENETVFLKRLEPYESEVPAQVLLLTAGVDVQGNRLEYLVTGWGEGFECWCIERGLINGDAGQVSTWNGLDEVLNKTRQTGDGRRLQIAWTFVDSGFSTNNVYDYCRRTRNRFAIKGKVLFGAPLVHVTNYNKDAGIYLTTLNVNEGKDELYSRLGLTEGAGRIHFGAEGWRGFDEVFFRQLLAEQKVYKRSGGVSYQTYEKVSRNSRNEAIDMLVYALAVARSLLGNGDEKTFWANQRGAEIKKARPVVRHKQIDIWN